MKKYIPTLTDYKALYKSMMNAATNIKEDYKDPSPLKIDPKKSDLRIFAFYLPQFHSIPENDRFWGKGFTEWTNVTKAVPQFVGHYQPHLPADLGFYNLSHPEIIEKQFQMAGEFGISGFCFHFYWFSGRRVLEKPLEILLKNKNITSEFCICWANENWTRRWDGLENDVLLQQLNLPGDPEKIFYDWLPIFKDKRYLKTPDGKPMVIIYRPSLLNDPKAAVATWRKLAVKNGLPGIFVMMTNSFSQPYSDIFDAIVEFPPHGMFNIKPTKKKMFNPSHSGQIIDIQKFFKSKAFLAKTSYPIIRTVFPGWDNEARKPGRGATFINLTPKDFNVWLSKAAKCTLSFKWRNRKKLVFINAWNEWAEGAHLEPDRKYGYAYLNEVARVVERHKI